jgi:hypothetical protein
MDLCLGVRIVRVSLGRVVLMMVVCLSVCALASGSASAASPWWHVTSGAEPTDLPPGGEGTLVVAVTNLGDAAAEGATSPIRIVDALPSGLTASTIKANVIKTTNNKLVPITCSLVLYSCETNETITTGTVIEMLIKVKVSAEDASGQSNGVSVSGGQAPSISISRPVLVGESTPFGVQENEFSLEEEGGQPPVQAGSHPFQVTSTIMLNRNAKGLPASLAKDVSVELPAGMVGNPAVTPKCTIGQFLKVGENYNVNECAPQTALGIATVHVYSASIGYAWFTVPIFNLEPAYGEPARFGFYVTISNAPVILDTSLRDGPGEDYGITVTAHNITQIASFISSQLTFWGTPGDPRHNDLRGWGCLYHAQGVEEGNKGEVIPCSSESENHPEAFQILPTSCSGGPLATFAQADSWKEPDAVQTVPPTETPPTLDGCNRLPFAPTMNASPTTTNASSASGLEINLNVHDEGLVAPEGLAQSDLNRTEVQLPEGLTIDPSAGVGLVGCTPEDYARETLDSAPGAGCPNESKLGTVEIDTPLLTQKIEGNIFIAQPYDNPFPEPEAGHPNGTLVALYIVAKNPETGVMIKLEGKVVPNPVTGQLTTVFENNPQLPFDHFNFHFREGAQAPLITPPLCGAYGTQAVLSPWSEPTAPLTDISSFALEKSYDGGACPPGGLPPFTPGIVAGTSNDNAASFSPFYLDLSRNDGEQEISGFSTNLPAGLSGDLSGIPFCPDADIEASRQETGAQEEADPSCPAASQIGHTLVGTGVGSVLAYVPGKIYLAGPFHGAPLSIVSITSAVVGPFDLGTVVLRFGLNIDPLTAKVNVTPTSAEPIPTIIKGIVTHVRDIRVYIDRPNFIVSPTSCNPLSIASTLNTPTGATSTVTSAFQDSNCQALKFEPQFQASTSGHTSRSEGASLHVKLTYPTNALGHDANIAKVKVDLPRQLPSRLSTLQKACTAAQFEANPAGCPAESRVGQAKAITPLIPEPLEGPAYFVSHGGAKFPELIFVLQGYGFTIDIHAETYISKAGITSSTIPAVPDQPIGSFELTLPEGKYSALAANGELCKSTLTMPTAFVAQNGAEIHQSTPIEVTGCAPSISIVRHSVKGATVTIAAKVPSAGKLVASGSGLTRASKSTGKAGTLSFSLKLSGRERALLKSHPGRRLAVAVKLTFTPTHGKKLTAGMTVNVG